MCTQNCETHDEIVRVESPVMDRLYRILINPLQFLFTTRNSK